MNLPSNEINQSRLSENGLFPSDGDVLCSNGQRIVHWGTDLSIMKEIGQVKQKTLLVMMVDPLILFILRSSETIGWRAEKMVREVLRETIWRRERWNREKKGE